MAEKEERKIVPQENARGKKPRNSFIERRGEEGGRGGNAPDLFFFQGGTPERRPKYPLLQKKKKEEVKQYYFSSPFFSLLLRQLARKKSRSTGRKGRERSDSMTHLAIPSSLRHHGGGECRSSEGGEKKKKREGGKALYPLAFLKPLKKGGAKEGVRSDSMIGRRELKDFQIFQLCCQC